MGSNTCPFKPFGKTLDVCASTRVMWKGRDTSNATFMDILPSVSPDVVGSFTSLPFRSNVFDSVWCDPPHLIRNDVKHWNSIYTRFGNYKNRREFEKTWLRMNTEFARVLVSNGVLVLKMIYGKDHRVPKRDDVEMFYSFDEVDRVEYPSRVGWSSNTTAWIRMVKA